MKKLILLLLLLPIISIGQTLDYGNSIDAAKLCVVVQDNSFSTNKDADTALNKILSVIGASKRFVVQPCGNIDNAVAVSYKGIRYILYDNAFMSEIANKTNTWSNTSILAHEVGHHINGHSVDVLLLASDVVKPKSLGDKRLQELEADEFSGFILAKLGATLTQASEAISLLANDKDDSFSTHPSKSKRLNAIKIGFNNAMGNNPVKYEKTSTALTAEEYFYRGYEKVKLKDYYSAIEDYSKALELNPNYTDAFNNRGNAKFKLKDYYSAISDYSKAIELEPNYSKVYRNRGDMKFILEDFYGAISDYNKAIELDPNNIKAYGNRGNLKFILEDFYGAISDYSKAIELDPNNSMNFYNRGNVKKNLNDSYGAISDYNKAIALDPTYSDAYFNRGQLKRNLKDSYGAISDYTKAIEFNPNYASAYYNRGFLKGPLKDYYGAISDFTKAIELNCNLKDEAYFNRGVSKYKLGNKNSACQDARKAQQLGYDASLLINATCK